jgi:hypothetical protein
MQNQKRKPGRPKKIVTAVAKKTKTNINWKSEYEKLVELTKSNDHSHEEYRKTANEILEKQITDKLEMVTLVMNCYQNIQSQCLDAVEITGGITMEDINYTVNFAKRALLHKFSQFDSAE